MRPRTHQLWCVNVQPSADAQCYDVCLCVSVCVCVCVCVCVYIYIYIYIYMVKCEGKFVEQIISSPPPFLTAILYIYIYKRHKWDCTPRESFEILKQQGYMLCFSRHASQPPFYFPQNAIYFTILLYFIYLFYSFIFFNNNHVLHIAYIKI